jgi:NADPH-dependent curcumin reductase CurA
VETTAVSKGLADGDVLVRTLLLSIDAAARTWMQGRTYRDRLEEGDVIPGVALCQVIEQRGTGLEPGVIVRAEPGWQDYAVLPARSVSVVEPDLPLSHHLSVFDVTGFTAYFGLLEIGKPRPGETVVVSAAAGATGSLVGQIARLGGARVVGITGSEAKATVLRDQLGFDAVVNHRGDDVRAALRSACPDGADVYFDNVGGPLLDTVLRVMNQRGRVVCCGAASQYDGASPIAGPASVPGLVVTRRLRLEGFIVFDFDDRYPEAARALRRWVQAGDLVVLEDVTQGLSSAPAALVGLLAGANLGKQLVAVADAIDASDITAG